MIYLPKRGCFIHIPRAAGNSITSAIACSAVGQNVDTILSTGNNYDGLSVARHSPAGRLVRLIPDWNDIYKFAVIRPDEDRLESVSRLIERDLANEVHKDSTCSAGWRAILTEPEARKVHDDDFKKTTNDWYTLTPKGRPLGVDLIPYEELEDRWGGICDRLNIPKCELRRLNSGLHR